MNETQIIELTRQAIIVTMEISTPAMMVGLIVGVLIALVQALTQIQEMTLVFVPKIIAIFIALIAFLPFMTHTLMSFALALTDQIVGVK